MTEVDRIASAYRNRDQRAALRWDAANAGNRLIVAERKQMTRELLERQGWLPLGERRVLDVGCGGGSELAWFHELGASDSRLAGIDLLPERIELARRTFPGIDFRAGNAEHLPFPDASFDLVLAYTMFSSILDTAMAANVASEVTRVLRPGGGLLWYDFRYDSPTNRNVRGIRAETVRRLFPDLSGELLSLTLLPPVARRLGFLASAAYRPLALIRPLRSHLLGLLLKPSHAV